MKATIKIERKCSHCFAGMVRSTSKNPDDCHWEVCDECDGRSCYVIRAHTQTVEGGRLVTHIQDKSLHPIAWCRLSAAQHQALLPEPASGEALDSLHRYMQSVLCEQHNVYGVDGCDVCEEEEEEERELEEDDYARRGLLRSDFL